jgi:hypothetical protein
LTQAEFAELLDVDLGTVQAWETGRRPLANVRAGVLLGLKWRLPALGADQTLVRLLDTAMDADRIIESALAPPARTSDHPLAGWVHNRETAHMIAWAVNGMLPPAVGDRSRTRRQGAGSRHLDIGEVHPAPTGSLRAVEHSPPLLLVPLTHDRSHHARNRSAVPPHSSAEWLLLAALPSPLLLLLLTAFRPLTLVEVAPSSTLHRLVRAAASPLDRPPALPLLPLTHDAPRRSDWDEIQGGLPRSWTGERITGG